MKDTTSRFTRKCILLAAFLLAFFDTAVFYALRANWVFISVNLPVPGPRGLFLITASLAEIFLLLLGLRLWEDKRKDVPLFIANGFRVVCGVVFRTAKLIRKRHFSNSTRTWTSILTAATATRVLSHLYSSSHPTARRSERSMTSEMRS